MPKVKAISLSKAPPFTDTPTILLKHTLQKTDIGNNNNKFYALELQEGNGEYRVFTHYGRTDLLAKNPEYGTKQVRIFDTEQDARTEYESIKSKKEKKGYIEVELAESATGTSSQHSTDLSSDDEPESTLPEEIQTLVRRLYTEARERLENTVDVTITASGIRTPLGILTHEQIERGQDILDQAFGVYQSLSNASKTRQKTLNAELVDLSNQFFSAIPHRLGRTRDDMQIAILDTPMEFEEKQETLQLMRDMLNIVHSGTTTTNRLDAQYASLGCSIHPMNRRSKKYRDLKTKLEDSQVKVDNLEVVNIWEIRRNGESDRFVNRGNEQLLIHGSGPQNFVGILSRGLLMPKVVIKHGVDRTDEGWLGNGIYFANALCTTLYYAHPDGSGSRFAVLSNVSLGRQCTYTEITYGIQEPPDGFDSCYGISYIHDANSEFEDDELVIYTERQQYLTHLIEYREN